MCVYMCVHTYVGPMHLNSPYNVPFVLSYLQSPIVAHLVPEELRTHYKFVGVTQTKNHRAEYGTHGPYTSVQTGTRTRQNSV